MITLCYHTFEQYSADTNKCYSKDECDKKQTVVILRDVFNFFLYIYRFIKMSFFFHWFVAIVVVVQQIFLSWLPSVDDLGWFGKDKEVVLY
jgi:hypothetical protein